MDLYCVKCRARTGTLNQTTTVTKNNRNALTGNCATCVTKKFRFVSKSGTSKPVTSQPKPKKPKKTPVKKKQVKKQVKKILEAISRPN